MVTRLNTTLTFNIAHVNLHGGRCGTGSSQTVALSHNNYICGVLSLPALLLVSVSLCNNIVQIQLVILNKLLTKQNFNIFSFCLFL